MMVSDLDGTLLDPDHRLRDSERSTLEGLGEAGILRVVATGRNLLSLRRVLEDDAPVDYVVFSSGAGIVNWPKRELLHSAHIPEADAMGLLKTLWSDERMDFMVHAPVPGNHAFKWRGDREKNPDFDRRIRLYEDHAQALSGAEDWSGDASQFLVVGRPGRLGAAEVFDSLRRTFTGFKVIRTTSPLDHASVWVEIFPEEVSKARAARLLAEKYAVPREKTVGVGNDYNDLDLLEWVSTPLVVGNAPELLKSRFDSFGTNAEEGFSQAVRHWLKLIE